MTAHYSGSCPKCKRRLGWWGTALDRPACRCGHQVPREELEADERQVEEFRQLLLARPAKATCQRQRKLAGLTLGQAAKLLGIPNAQLADYEADDGPAIPEEMVALMAETYGCGEEPE